MFPRFPIIQHQQGKIVNCPKSNKNNRITYYTGDRRNKSVELSMCLWTE